MKLRKFRGLTILIENPAGSTRSGVDPRGKKWSIVMPYDYGEIVGSMGVDGDPVDCFIGSDNSAEFAYVIHQVTKASGEWDEDKVMLGFTDTMAAKLAYEKCFDEPDHFYGQIEAIPMGAFKKKVMETKGNPQMIHAKLEILCTGIPLSSGAPVTVDGFHGRGVIKSIKNGRATIQFRNGLIISRMLLYVHGIDSDYRSQYQSLKAATSPTRTQNIPIDDTLTHHAYKTIRWTVDPNDGHIYEPDHPMSAKVRKMWRKLIDKANKHITSSIQAGGIGSGRHKSSLNDRQSEARKEYRRMYKLAKQAGHDEQSARTIAVEAYLTKFKSIRAGGPGSGRKKGTGKGLNKWRDWSKEISDARKNPKQMKLDLKGGLEDVEMEGPPEQRGKSIEKVGTQFCVRSGGVDKNLGCYPSKEQATAVMKGKSFIEPLLPKGMQAGGLGSGRHKYAVGDRVMRNPKVKGWHNSTEHDRGVILEQKWGKDNKGKGGLAYQFLSDHEAKEAKRKDLDPIWDRNVGKGSTYLERELVPEKIKKVKAFADYGEPNAGAMQHAHIDPKVWFKPPSKKNHEPVPTDDVGETNDKYLDVTKRKQAHKDRMKILKRSAPGGSPPQIPARTTLLSPHSAVYVPGATFASAHRGRVRRNGGQFRGMNSARI